MTPDEVTPERAAAIAAGEATFDTEHAAVVPPAAPGMIRVYVSQLLVWATASMAVITIVSIACLTAFSIYRGQERRSFNRTVAELARDLDAARGQRDQLQLSLNRTNEAVECRALSQLDLEAAQADAQATTNEQFAEALDRRPPAADVAAIRASAARLREAIRTRAVALGHCSNPTPDGATPGIGTTAPDG